MSNPRRMMERQGMFEEENQGRSGMVENPVQSRMMRRSDFEFEPAFPFAEQLKALLAFGFSEDACKNALIATEGNVEEAVNVLLA